MPKTLDSYLADRALTRQLYLMRFSAGEQKKVLAILTQMQKELRLKLMGDQPEQRECSAHPDAPTIGGIK